MAKHDKQSSVAGKPRTNK